MDRLTLTPGGIYAWTMYPGYGAGPYRSPIQVIEVCSAGGRDFDLEFVNVFYAVGVQRMAYRLRTLRREKSYLIAEHFNGEEPTERVVIIEYMTLDWIRLFIPGGTDNPRQFFDEFEQPDPAAFLALMGGS